MANQNALIDANKRSSMLATTTAQETVRLVAGTDGLLRVQVQGNDAENAAASGNPVLVGGRYDATDRTLNDGDVGGIALEATGQIKASLSLAEKEAQRRAIDAIIEEIGLENIDMFLPLFETSGTIAYDLIDRDLQFEITGATPDQASPAGRGVSTDGVNDILIQKALVEATAYTSQQELDNPNAVAAQQLEAFSGEIDKITWKLQKQGTPDGSIKCEIREATKDGSVIATSSLMSCSDVYAASAAQHGFDFSTPPTLQHDTTYWAVVLYDSNTNADGTNYIAVGYDNLGTYGQGRSYYNGTTWVDSSGEDYTFSAYQKHLTFEGDFSVVALAKWTGSAGSGAKNILTVSGMTTYAFTMQMTNEGFLRALVNDGTAAGVSKKVIPNEWFTLGVSFDTSDTTTDKVKLYYNGKYADNLDSATGAGDILRPAQPIAVGGAINLYGSSTLFWPGVLGPIIKTSNVLSAANFAEIHRSLSVMRYMREAI